MHNALIELSSASHATVCFPSPDDHVAVATHGRACASRDVLRHLDQSVLVAGVRLRDGPSRDQTLLDAGASAALHGEGRSDHASLGATACMEAVEERQHSCTVTQQRPER